MPWCGKASPATPCCYPLGEQRAALARGMLMQAES